MTEPDKKLKQAIVAYLNQQVEAGVDCDSVIERAEEILETETEALLEKVDGEQDDDDEDATVIRLSFWECVFLILIISWLCGGC